MHDLVVQTPVYLPIARHCGVLHEKILCVVGTNAINHGVDDLDHSMVTGLRQSLLDDAICSPMGIEQTLITRSYLSSSTCTKCAWQFGVNAKYSQSMGDDTVRTVSNKL